MSDNQHMQPADGGLPEAIAQRFEEHLPLLERVVSQILLGTGGSVRDMVYLGALVLLRAAAEWDESTGLSFKEYAEVTLTSELLHHAHYPVPVLKLPAELAAYAPRLNAIAQALASMQPPMPTALTTFSAHSARYPAMAAAYQPQGGFIGGPAQGPAGPKAANPAALAWKLLMKRLPLILGLVILTEAGIVAHTVTSPKTWVAYSTLNSGIGTQDPLGGGGDWFTQGTIVANITELLKSRTVLEATIGSLGLETSPEKLAKRITVNRMGQTGLLKVEAEAETPEAASELVNTNVREFLRYYATSQSHEARSNKAFFESQVKMAGDRLKNAEESLKQFKGAKMPEVAAGTPGRLADLIAQRDEASRALAAAQAGLGAVQRELRTIKADPLLTQRIVNSGAVMTASEKLRELQMNMMDARDIYGKDHPVVNELANQIAKAKGQLRTTTVEQSEQNPALADATARVVQLKTEIAMQGARLSSLNRSIAELEPKARSASTDQVTYEQLMREVTIAAAQYQDLQTKFGQSHLMAQGASNLNISVVDAALPPKEPLSSKLVLKLILGLILSLGLGLFISFLISLREKPEPEAFAEGEDLKLLNPGMSA